MRMFAVIAVVLASTLMPVNAQTMWPAVTEYPATSMPGEGLARFAALVSEATQGRVTVKPAYDGAGGLKSAGIPNAVQAGRIVVGDSFAGALSGLNPIFQLSSLPFLATSLPEARALRDAA